MAVAKNIQDHIIWLKTYFKQFEGKRVTLTFGPHTFTNVTITSIDAKPVTGFKLAPDKRMVDGKMKSPQLIQIITDNTNKLVFTVEDTVWTAITNGMRAKVGDTVVEFRQE
jgi:hypothetical protein